MTGSVALGHGRRRSRQALPVLLAVASAGGWAVLARADPAAAARGALAGWFMALSVALGGAVLVLIHALTGGRWRRAGEPWLTAAAGAVPALALLGLGLIAAMHWLYPWATASWAPEPQGGAPEAWLDEPLFALRTVGALLVFGGLGVLARRRPRPGAAAAGLVAYGVALSVAALDWLLTLDPSFSSTDFAAQMAILQIGAGLALPALLGLGAGDPQARSDWCGLLIAAALGSTYLAAMQFLVSWSGDLPDKAAWYLERQGAGLVLVWGALWLGAIVPVALLLLGRLRRSRAVARLAGGSALAGAALHLAWIVTPSGPGLVPALAAAALVLGGLGSLATAGLRR